MPPFIEQLRTILIDLELPGQTLLIGLSGGGDSVALLHGLHELQDPLDLKLYAAHLDHGLRGAESESDAEWVREFCCGLGVDCVIERRDIAQAAQESGRGIEEAAREERYRFLEEQAVRLEASSLCVGHTQDDNVETILHHIVRGTGLAGLTGISARRRLPCGVTIVRPLLSFSRADLEAYLNEVGQSWRRDSTNDDESYTRNRIRQTLLPLLRNSFNPAVDDALLRLAWQAAEAQQAMQHLAERTGREVLLDASDTCVRIDCVPLADAPAGFVREVLRAIWIDRQWPRRGMNYSHWESLRGLVCGGSVGVSLPGSIQASRRANLLILEYEKRGSRVASGGGEG